ncbi:MAG: UbiA family prenyltransferase [Burkholderiaceae bacterium]|nr:UbiA family prenyltransferase [Burkholderiaceae bacterium]
MNGDDRSIPLYVDLDGCLLRTDTLWESFAAALRANPVAGLFALFTLLQGRAALKRRLAAIGQADVASMPRNERFVGWLRAQRARGRRVVLATAADSALAVQAAQVAQVAQSGEAVQSGEATPDSREDALFDAVLSSDGARNLKGPNKLAAIRDHAGDAPFDYCGNGPEDVAIFAQARRAIVVGASPRVLAAARRESNVSEVFDARSPWPARARALLRAMRPHQWLKNLLVLVPLLTSFRVGEMPAFFDAALAFVSFSLAASSGYLLNDLLDLSADRRHPRKRLRPFAAGELSVRSGFAAAALLFVASIALAFAVGNTFVGWVLAYLAMTGAYSGFAKRVALLDVAALAGLYTVRVLAGGAAIGVEVSFWLLAFSVFLFFSLALVKRCGEIVAQLERDEATGGGRGYRVRDLPVLQALGIGASFAALVVLALYVQTPEVTQRYASPQLLWLMLVGLLILLGRMWLSTARGEMHDDPLVYAIEDRASRWTVGALLVLFAAAATLRLPF